ncbi:MAG: GAF domain-containing SpoIIE family protein phosphatase [Candidatus Kryptoniota bacterium]
MTNTNPDNFNFLRLEEENQRLKRAVDELSVLNELATAIGALNNSEEVIRKIINRSLRAVSAEQGVITLVEEEPNQPMKTLVRTMVSSSEHGQFHFNQALLGWMILNKKALLVNDPPRDERFRGITWDGSVHSVLCVPLLTRSALKGVLTVYNKKGGNGFTEDDQRILSIIAAQSAQVVENARLYEEERNLMKMQQEVKLASQIQADLLPKKFPSLSGYDIAGATFPARTIGGDYFDFISVDDRKLAICLGDVSGKGLPAALLMANLQASLRSQTYNGNSVKECISRCNHQLYQSTSPEKFATLFYGILDTQNHTLTYCNAGHEPPFLISGEGDPVRLREGGTMIGIMDGFAFDEAVIVFRPGDILVTFSDGVTEAMNLDREQFGESKLTDLMRENVDIPAERIIEEIVKAVRTHAGEAPQYDDITALVVRREPT